MREDFGKTELRNLNHSFEKVKTIFGVFCRSFADVFKERPRETCFDF